MGDASYDLLKLRPVTFRYKADVTEDRQREFGLIAEEVAEVYPELVGRNADGQVVTVRYDQLIPMLLNELQRQQRKNEEQQQLIREIPKLREEIQALTARVAELEAN